MAGLLREGDCASPTAGTRRKRPLPPEFIEGIDEGGEIVSTR
jgi:hypothetical protein